jgi:trehalose 6-phosphate synthase/phosphatase
MLRQHPDWKGKVVMVQVVNPARGKGKDIEEAQNEAHTVAERINEEFWNENYKPVVLLERYVPLYDRIAFYTIAECCVVTAVRDGMNLIPYEYIACQEGGSYLDIMAGRIPESLAVKKGMLIVSEFIGCSPSLSGAI